MKNSKIIIALVAVVFVIGAIVIVVRNPKNSADKTPVTVPVVSAPVNKPVIKDNPVSTQPPTQSAVTPPFPLAEVSKHNNSTDCWSAINGKVYNLTSWISKHPGGSSAIISLCGIDGSTAYNGVHGQQKRPANELAAFEIGVLK